jgi:hypothetical protein
MTADAASFVNAHQNVVGVSSGNPASATSQVFPSISSSDITTTVLPAPSPTIYVDYGYNDPNPTVAANSASNRHGGASIMEPSQMQSTVAKSSVTSILGIPIGVTGSMIEPQWMENGAHFDVANLNYGSTASNMQVDYFTNGENVPPYYVGFNYMAHCMDNMPWTSATCSTAGTDFTALGVAEHLDDSNWSIPLNQGGSAISGSWGASATGGANASTFTQMACHQRYFSQFAAFLVNYPTLSSVTTAFGTPAPNSLVHNLNGTRPDGSTGELPMFTGFHYLDSNTNSVVQTIYSWDREVSAGYPNAQTYPGPGASPVYPWYSQGGTC